LNFLELFGVTLFADFGKDATVIYLEHIAQELNKASALGDWGAYHAHAAMHHKSVTGKRVLVVGCNTGTDCLPFLKFSPSSIVGVDIMADIGKDVTDPKISYVNHTVESLPLESDQFDLIYSFATLEHVPDIDAAYAEMARVLAPDGLIYCVAAPLWCSRYGPHWPASFDNAPWPHLRFDTETIVELGVRAGIPEINMLYFLGNHCNKKRAGDYLAAGDATGLSIIRNDIEHEQECFPDVARDLFCLGYKHQDLYGGTHVYIAQK
jgi:SAM-dependent methyltransferase